MQTKKISLSLKALHPAADAAADDAEDGEAAAAVLGADVKPRRRLASGKLDPLAGTASAEVCRCFISRLHTNSPTPADCCILFLHLFLTQQAMEEDGAAAPVEADSDDDIPAATASVAAAMDASDDEELASSRKRKRDGKALVAEGGFAWHDDLADSLLRGTAADGAQDDDDDDETQTDRGNQPPVMAWFSL